LQAKYLLDNQGSIILMSINRKIAFVILGFVVWMTAASARSQIVINEMVDDERSSGSGQIADTREFVELYNSGASAVDISGWALNAINIGLTPGVAGTYTLPAATSIPSHGYYVVGAAGVPNVNFSPAPAVAGEYFPNTNFILELRNPAASLVDALATETFRDPERANLTPEQVAKVAGGYWGQTISCNSGTLNPTVQSFARFKDGVTTNSNGRDFGFLPVTPGASNNLLSEASHTIPNVDGMITETALTANYYSSFVVPRVMDPANADGIVNQSSIPASPQGGQAIMAYDETGGGNVAYSKKTTNKFDLYAYVETAALASNLVSATQLQRSEASTYGIGTSDPFFGSPNSSGLTTLASSSNGNTGFGWVIEKVIDFNGGLPKTSTALELVNFGASGDSVPAKHEWQILKTYDLSTSLSTWHRLSVDYNPTTGVVTAKNDADTFTFTTAGDYNNNGVVDAADYVVWRDRQGAANTLPNTNGAATVDQSLYDLWRANFGQTATKNFTGNFYVGYRESLGGALASARPPTYDMVVGPGAGSLIASVPEPSSIILALGGLLFAGARRTRWMR
jgi:hypothetical protein